LEVATLPGGVTPSTNTGGFAIVADIVGTLISFHLACIPKVRVTSYPVLHSLHDPD
jgi:hypothetical protein